MMFILFFTSLLSIHFSHSGLRESSVARFSRPLLSFFRMGFFSISGMNSSFMNLLMRSVSRLRRMCIWAFCRSWANSVSSAIASIRRAISSLLRRRLSWCRQPRAMPTTARWFTKGEGWR